MNARSDQQRKKAPHPKRTTFLEGREVLERSVEVLEDARASLREKVTGDPRGAMFWRRLDGLESDLTEAIDRFRQMTPPEVLSEQTQYTTELPALEEPPPDDLEAVMAWSLTLLGWLRERFREMAESAGKESQQEAFEGLATLVAGHEKRIAQLQQGLQDI